MLPFIRSDLGELSAYTPNPGGTPDEPAPISPDRLDANESPYDLPEDLKQKQAWTYLQEIESNRYPDGTYTALKQTIAEYVCESAAHEPADNITPDNISAGNGSDELIRSLIIATCLRGEGSVLVANPTFSMYGILAETLGVPVVPVGRNPTNFEIDLAAAQLAIEKTQNPPVRAVFVVHPNSPTANALTPAELDWLRSLPPQILAVIDEAYFEFSRNTVAGELHLHPNWVILRTFSKGFRLAAHRIGYAIGNPELIAALEKIRLPYNLPSFTQVAALSALRHRRELLASVPEIIADRDKLRDALAQMPALQVWPSDANFIYLRLKDAGGADALANITQQLRAGGTLVRHTGGGLRITVGTPEENARTIQRLQSGIGHGA
jgi:histidinol-phosphate aminotransferase